MKRLAPRANLPEPLSGLQEPAVVELGCGLPWITLSEINRLVRQQGIAPALARAWLLDELVQAIPLTAQREQELLHHWTQHHVPKGEALTTWLQRQRLEPNDLLVLASQSERLERFRRFHFQQEVELHFLRCKANLDQVVYSLLRVSDHSLAEELHQRLLEMEESFDALASVHAEGPERNSGGRVGPLPLSKAHAEIAGRLRVSLPGQLWPPFAIDNVWVVLRLEQHQPARLDAGMRDRLLHELFEDWLQQRLELLRSGQPLPPLPPLPAADELLP